MEHQLIDISYDSEREGAHLSDCLLPQTGYPCACCQEIACEVPCICRQLQDARSAVLSDVISAINTLPEDQDAAVWFERFGDNPENPDEVTVMVQLDRVIRVIESFR